MNDTAVATDEAASGLDFVQAGSTGGAESRSQHQASIKSLMAAMAQLPEEEAFVETRAHMQKQIDAHKRAITKINPLGAQLDGCKAALERSIQRRQQAQEALEQAQANVAKAEEEQVALAEELSMLEAQVATHGTEHEDVRSNCIEKLAMSLQTVLSEMASGAVVPPELLAATEAQMASLLGGVRQIAEAVNKAQAEARPGTGSLPVAPKRETEEGLPSPVRRKIVGKQPDAEMLPSELKHEDAVITPAPGCARPHAGAG